MQDFLQQTLSGSAPRKRKGETDFLCWQWLDHGILLMEPKEKARRALVLSAGIHGNETAPVEMVNRLLLPLLRGEKPLQQRLLVILGNPVALKTGKRYLRYDINRLFGGRWQQIVDGDEAHRVLRLEQAVETFWQACETEETRWHLDLHTAIRGSYHARFGLMPYTERPWPPEFMHWLAASGMEALVFHRAPGGTFTYFSCEHFAAASCTLELGKARPFGKNDLSQFAAAEQALAGLLYGEAVSASASQPKHYRVTQQITRQSEDFVLHMGSDTLNFTAFPQGTLLAEDSDTRYYVQQAREYVLFPNPDVVLGLRAGLMLIEESEQTQALPL